MCGVLASGKDIIEATKLRKQESMLCSERAGQKERTIHINFSCSHKSIFLT